MEVIPELNNTVTLIHMCLLHCRQGLKIPVLCDGFLKDDIEDINNTVIKQCEEIGKAQCRAKSFTEEVCAGTYICSTIVIVGIIAFILAWFSDCLVQERERLRRTVSHDSVVHRNSIVTNPNKAKTSNNTF